LGKGMTAFPDVKVWFPRTLKLFHVVALSLTYAACTALIFENSGEY
jgi:hypothetical protein